MLTNFKQEDDMPNFILESFFGKQFGIWIVRERDGRLKEWLASITAIYVKNDWKWSKPIEVDVERVNKFEIYVEVWIMRSIECREGKRKIYLMLLYEGDAKYNVLIKNFVRPL